MRVALVLAVLALLAADAGAARKPTSAERAAVTLAVLTQVPDTAGNRAAVVVRRVVVSTVRPGPRSAFSRFAAAFVVARDSSGYPPGPRTAVIGLQERTKGWIMVGYGPNRAVCREPQSFFGGRRAAILRDLGIRCV